MSGLEVLGAIAAVSQLAHYSWSLLEKTKGIRGATDGQPINSTHIDLVTKELCDLAQKLQASSPGADPSLDKLCNGLLDSADRLQGLLEKTKIHGRKTRWKSFRSALKHVWGKENLVELETRLAMYRDALNLYLQNDFR